MAPRTSVCGMTRDYRVSRAQTMRGGMVREQTIHALTDAERAELIKQAE